VSANVYAVTLSPAPTIVAGSIAVVKIANSNTGASTLSVNGGSATAIKKTGSTALASGDLRAGRIAVFTDDGTNWQYVNPPGSSRGMTNPMTTKGDVIVGAASETPARLGVGADGYVLTARSSATDGVDWEAASGGGGGGSSFPLTIVQETFFQSGGSAVTSFTVRFPQAAASSGNTLFMLVSSDGSQALTTPGGWTVDFN
jgi:hypothetical protein